MGAGLFAAPAGSVGGLLSASVSLRHQTALPHAALERGGFEGEAEFGGAPPGATELAASRPARDLRVFVAVLAAGRITEIIGMELCHHVERRSRHVLGNPFQHR